MNNSQNNTGKRAGMIGGEKTYTMVPDAKRKWEMIVLDDNNITK